MSLEAIKTINEAEESSKRARQEAAQKARRIIAQAEDAGRGSVEGAAQKAQDELAVLKKQATDKARQEAVDLARNTENRKAAMLVKAESRKEQAIDFIIERIVRS